MATGNHMGRRQYLIPESFRELVSQNNGPELTLDSSCRDVPTVGRLLEHGLTPARQLDGASYHSYNDKIDKLVVVYDDVSQTHETEHPADHLHSRRPSSKVAAAVPTSTSRSAALLRLLLLSEMHATDTQNE